MKVAIWLNSQQALAVTVQECKVLITSNINASEIADVLYAPPFQGIACVFCKSSQLAAFMNNVIKRCETERNRLHCYYSP